MIFANLKIQFLTIFAGALLLAAAVPAVQAASTCTVTTTADSADGLPPVSGSLRDCLELVTFGDTITFDPTVFDLVNSDAATTIDVQSGLPPLDDGGVTIDGSDRRVTVNGSGANSSSGLHIVSSSNLVRGLAIVGFPRSGVVLEGGAGNTIGGPRSTGSGPNGQGLRIAGNGAFGIEIIGSGATANVIKGCWIGLDKSGLDAQPNLAGVVVQDGASGNTIGGVIAAEANVISGNAFEGVTLAGAGTDDNVVIGNVIGGGAVEDTFGQRSAIGNGSAGVFLSRGTQGSTVGGLSSSESNYIAFNGGNGIEIRSASTRRNSAQGNSILRNQRGGIALFDNANDGITAPRIISVQELGPNAMGTGLTLRITGETSPAGTLEIFNDSGSQGETFLDRGAVAGGAWSADVDVSNEALHLTATLTDSLGNTGRLSAFGLTGEDSDGDGFSDEIEALADTDPDSLLNTPDFAGALTVSKLAIRLNFSSPGKDSIKITTSVVLPSDFTSEGSHVGVFIAGHSEQLVLGPDGKASTDTSSVTLKTSIKSGPVLSYGIKLASLQAALAASGLSDKSTTVDGERWVLPVAVTLGSSVSYGTVTLTYKATQGKTGRAK